MNVQAPICGWHRLALGLVLSTVALVGIGGLVTSHGAGMAVPDWPNSYGYNMFAFPMSQWVGGILFEHSHRLWASFVGFLTLVFALWTHGIKSRPWLRWGGLLVLGLAAAAAFKSSVSPGNVVFLAATGAVSLAVGLFWPRCEPASPVLRRLTLFALVLVVLQGVLGGLRVVLFKDQIGIFHAALAQIFLCLCGVMALVTSAWWRDRKNLEALPPAPSMLRTLAALLAGAVFGQLILGASMRHQHAGLAVPDFPMAHGKLWPPTDEAFLETINNTRVDARDFAPITRGQIHLHMAHRVAALAIAALVVVVLVAASRETGRVWRRWARFGAGLVAAQVGLGAWTVWSGKAADIATAHVVLGALTLMWCVLFLMVLRTAALCNVRVGRDAINARRGSFAAAAASGMSCGTID